MPDWLQHVIVLGLVALAGLYLWRRKRRRKGTSVYVQLRPKR